MLAGEMDPQEFFGAQFSLTLQLTSFLVFVLSKCAQGASTNPLHGEEQ